MSGIQNGDTVVKAFAGEREPAGAHPDEPAGDRAFQRGTERAFEGPGDPLVERNVGGLLRRTEFEKDRLHCRRSRLVVIGPAER